MITFGIIPTLIGIFASNHVDINIPKKINNSTPRDLKIIFKNVPKVIE